MKITTIAKVKTPTALFFVPTTQAEFDTLIKKVKKTYKQIQNMEHAEAVIANRIQHLPPDVATTTIQYLGFCVIKNMAWQLADSRGKTLHHKSQIDDFYQQWIQDPANAKAYDAIAKAALDGSAYASETLLKIQDAQDTERAVIEGKECMEVEPPVPLRTSSALGTID